MGNRKGNHTVETHVRGGLTSAHEPKVPEIKFLPPEAAGIGWAWLAAS